MAKASESPQSLEGSHLIWNIHIPFLVDSWGLMSHNAETPPSWQLWGTCWEGAGPRLSACLPF